MSGTGKTPWQERNGAAKLDWPEVVIKWQVPPEQMDELWANGWRRFGTCFYRYSSTFRGDAEVEVQPLRLLIEKFCPSKSQRRVLRRNSDLTFKVGPTCIDDTRRQLFEAHKQRFRENRPPSLDYYLGPQPAIGPCENVELALYEGTKLVAASYLDIGQTAASGVYAMFDLDQSRRSLGIYLMLLAIDYARKRGCRYYYPGYAFHSPSHYDYKKRLNATEWFDWKENWLPLDRADAS